MGLKYLVGNVLNNCSVIQALFHLFIEHRQSRFSIILKNLKIFGHDKLAVVSTKVTSYISP